MTPLAALLRDEIRARGPISLARYMELCLSHPEHGYYIKRDPLGAAGDFTTAPEVSQIFGEMAGLALAQAWRDQGAPSPAALVELGPGRGALMADALRVISRAAPDFKAAARLFMVETSPALRARQRQALSGADAAWLDRLEQAPALPLFLIANEFFDALPIRRYARAPGGWSEARVGLNGDGALTFLQAPAAPPAAAWARADALSLQQIEVRPLGEDVAAQIGRRLDAQGGAALIIDYGYGRDALLDSKSADTFQAVRRHRPADPLAAPGEADLTAHVDFDALAAAAGAAARGWGPIGQGAWLRRLGAEARAAQLARANPARAESIAAGLHRLTHPREMGTLFKAMALTSAAAPPPPGFEALAGA